MNPNNFFEYNNLFKKKINDPSVYLDLHQKKLEFLKNLISTITQKFNLSKFKYLSLLIHEKGKNFSIQIENEIINFKISKLDAQDFTNFFSSIKKSKNKSFGHSNLKGTSYNLFGTFIGKTFSWNNFNVILIISNQDFLPQKEEDILWLKECETLIEYHLRCNLELYSLMIKSNYLSYVSSELKIINQKTNHDLDFIHREKIILLGELLNTLRHELSNPIFGLDLSCTVISQITNLDEKQILFINEIKKSIKRASSILNQSSDVFNNNIKPSSFNVISAISEVLKFSRSETKDVEIAIVNLSSFPTPQILVQKTYFHQILFNLIINSSHALGNTPKKKIEITISTDKDEKNLLICIQDNGPNLPLELQFNSDIIFKPFFTTKKSGNGLGLAISLNLAHKIGGLLFYKKNEIGACFCLQIPFNSNDEKNLDN
jgi:two-component system NtrC family sensor kinase